VLSICIPCYRGAERLARLLASIPADDPDLELLVYDDGSPQAESAAIAKVFSKASVARKRFLCNERNRGPVAALRDVVAASTGELVLQLDDDVVLPAGFLNTLRTLLGIENVGVLSWRSEGTNAGQSKTPIPGMLQPATELAGYCMAYRRAVHDEVGGIDTRYRFYCSDSDFTLRVAFAGHPCYRVWWPLVPHLEHASVPDSAARTETGVRDQAIFNAKWGATGAEMERRALAQLLEGAHG
jgi:GT2 family glycosyltransferase